MADVRTKEAKNVRDLSLPFIRDLEPFLYGKRITYVDVGAFEGDVIGALIDSSITVRTAHLIEPNPKTFERLSGKRQEFSRVHDLHLHNVAASDAPGHLSFIDDASMSRVLSTEGKRSDELTVQAITLDELAVSYQLNHISLLKIDVEGHELRVLDGAQKILKSQCVDFIYIEAGMERGSNELTYYRDIEDALTKHGYGIYRIYEQKNQWIDDNPLLRRINIAFVSDGFARQNPYKVTNELFGLKVAKAELEALNNELEARNNALDALNNALDARNQDLAQQVSNLTSRAGELERENLEVSTQLTDVSAQRESAQKARDDLEAHNAELRKQISAREASLHDAEKARDELAEQCADLREKLSEQVAKRELAEKAYQDAVEHQASLERSVDALRAELAGIDRTISRIEQTAPSIVAAANMAPVVARLKRENARNAQKQRYVRSELEREIARAKGLSAELSKATARLDSMYASTSWRVTGPMRSLVNLFRRSKK
jgi:FkbM family methyltransferase